MRDRRELSLPWYHYVHTETEKTRDDTYTASREFAYTGNAHE